MISAAALRRGRPNVHIETGFRQMPSSSRSHHVTATTAAVLKDIGLVE